MKENLINVLAEEKIFPILRCNNAQTMIDRAKALIDAGIKVLEINVENPSIYKAVEEISKYASVCAGGIITSMQAEAAILSGAEILSSPIFSMNLVKISKDKQIPYIAGTSTANEAYNAWKARIPLIKIYPIIDEIRSYINAGASVVGVGRDLYDGYSLSEITARAKKVLKELKD